MRLFFAVLLPEAVREEVARVQAELRAAAGEDGIRWTQPEQFHFTLKFLGETPEAQIPLAAKAAQLTAAQSSPFALFLAHAGAFPNPRRPQVLWVGASEGVPLLARLAESLDSALTEQGFPPESRPFRPHLTLARIKDSRGAQAAAKALKTATISQKVVDKYGSFVVNSFVLMGSELRPRGPFYTVVATFPLAAP